MSRFQAACIESAVFAHEGGLALEHGDVELETDAPVQKAGLSWPL